MFCKPDNRINANIFNVFRPQRRVKLYVYKENFDWLFSCLWGIQRKGYIVIASYLFNRINVARISIINNKLFNIFK